MNRITDKQLDQLATYINELTGSPIESSSRDAEGRYRSNVGNYHISHAYGGVCLHRMSNTGGGVSTPLVSYHTTKRELYNAMQAFISGLNAVRYGDVNVTKVGG